ncbi:MAG: hypothetical protein H7062_13875 [Candidatus Saccharimonas sp.]|nr:hypothetical protein [Planctomycetaceae bacterium]
MTGSHDSAEENRGTNLGQSLQDGDSPPTPVRLLAKSPSASQLALGVFRWGLILLIGLTVLDLALQAQRVFGTRASPQATNSSRTTGP